MFSKILTKLVVRLFKSNLSMEDANLLTTLVLDKLGALPFSNIIEIGNEGLLINGRPVDGKEEIVLRESARLALDNKAHKLVRDQVAFLAVMNSTHKAETIPHVLWGRIGVWWYQQSEKYLKVLARTDQQPELNRD